jgi:penicillin-binding protein-related factor A (putative recombinase)
MNIETTKPTPLEATITKQIVRILRARPNLWFVKTHGGAMQSAGLPDIIGCYRGKFFAFEVKRPGNKATMLQDIVLQQIMKAGGIAQVVYSAREAVLALIGI